MTTEPDFTEHDDITEPLDQERVPATPNHPALANLPGPLNEDGTPQTLQEIQAELPEGADGFAIDVSLRNLMTQPNKTLSIIARKAYEAGVDGRPYVHHAATSNVEADVLRILLLTADEPRSAEAIEREEREKAEAKAALEAKVNIRGMFGLGRKR